MSQEAKRIKKIYNTVYRQDPNNRAYIWHPCNPVSIFYRQAQERALIALFNQFNLDLSQLRVLDVGCGGGGFLRFMGSLGVLPKNLYGLDLMPYRIKIAQSSCLPGTDLRIGDGEKLPYQNQKFNLVSQFTVFSAMFDSKVRKSVAQEMIRVLKHHGYILWYDMRGSKSETTRGLEKDEIKALFPGCKTKAIWKIHAPYIGRVAQKSMLLADAWDHLMFFKKTHYLILMQKN